VCELVGVLVLVIGGEGWYEYGCTVLCILGLVCVESGFCIQTCELVGVLVLVIGGEGW